MSCSDDVADADSEPDGIIGEMAGVGRTSPRLAYGLPAFEAGVVEVEVEPVGFEFVGSMARMSTLGVADVLGPGETRRSLPFTLARVGRTGIGFEVKVDSGKPLLVPGRLPREEPFVEAVAESREVKRLLVPDFLPIGFEGTAADEVDETVGGITGAEVAVAVAGGIEVDEEGGRAGKSLSSGAVG